MTDNDLVNVISYLTLVTRWNYLGNSPSEVKSAVDNLIELLQELRSSSKGIRA